MEFTKILFVVAVMVAWHLSFVTMVFCLRKMMWCFLLRGKLLGREGQLQLELHQDKILVGGALLLVSTVRLSCKQK